MGNNCPASRNAFTTLDPKQEKHFALAIYLKSAMFEEITDEYTKSLFSIIVIVIFLHIILQL